MRASINVTIGDKEFSVSELSVSDVRQWMIETELGSALVDPAGEFVFDDCSLSDLAMMCGVDAGVFDDFAPSELAPLLKVAKELNPHFFRGRAAVMAAQVSLVRRLLSPGTSNAMQSH